MLYTKTRAACSENNKKKHRSAVCEQSVQIWSVKSAGTRSNRQTLNIYLNLRIFPTTSIINEEFFQTASVL